MAKKIIKIFMLTTIIVMLLIIGLLTVYIIGFKDKADKGRDKLSDIPKKTKLEKEIAKLSGMLNNQNFVANAPKEVIEANKEALDSAEAKIKKVCEELEALGEK